MAKSNLKVEAYIETENGEAVLWYTIDESGGVIWHLPKDRAQEYKKRMMQRTGENLSMFLNSHPDAAMWEKTNHI